MLIFLNIFLYFMMLVCYLARLEILLLKYFSSLNKALIIIIIIIIIIIVITSDTGKSKL